MAIKIRRARRDNRVERILEDPEGYYAQARRKARVEVEKEMAAEQKRQRDRTATA